jgi:membrane-bound ClpP family serine protease
MHEIFKESADIIGILGVILLLTSYFLLSTGRLNTKNFSYPLCNFIAAWLILFSLFYNWNTPSVLIEIAWILISIVGMWRILKKR